MTQKSKRNTRRGISLTLSTIIVMIVVLVTLLAILYFFIGGFGEVGGGIGDISYSATRGIDDSIGDPRSWCAKDKTWYKCDRTNDPQCSGSSYATYYDCEATNPTADEYCDCIDPIT